jgi:LCP family protein required for cell wall assembly
MNWQPDSPNGKPWPGDRRASRAGQLCYNALAFVFELFGSSFHFMTQPPRMTTGSGRPRRRATLPNWAVGVLLGAFVLTTGFSAYLIYTSVRDFVAGWTITNPPGGPGVFQGATGKNTPAATSTLAPLMPKKWTGTERVTVLLMGIDLREGSTCEDQGRASRTDSMMLATVDPVGMTAAVLSIPRDLWVAIPGYENDTINTANFRGDAYSYPGGGPALAVKTVEYNFGVKVDYYVRMDFTAFEQIVDAIGGIEINNQEDIADEEYPDGTCGFEPFYLTAGPHHLNGHDALRYARTRHNSSDVGRGQRQREVALAALKRVQDPAMVPTLLAKAPGLYQSLNDNVKTNLTLDQIVALGLLVRDVPEKSVQLKGIDYSYVQEYQTDAGRQVLLPWWDKIRELRDSLFTSAAVKPHATIDVADPAKLASEAARVEVLNGAGVQGLAQSTADWLQAQGVNVVSYGTADRVDYATTIIVDYTGNAPYTALWLAKVFNVAEANIIRGSDASNPIDLKVILGQDWSVPPGAGSP